jgi:hypothetical protein
MKKFSSNRVSWDSLQAAHVQVSLGMGGLSRPYRAGRPTKNGG